MMNTKFHRWLLALCMLMLVASSVLASEVGTDDQRLSFMGIDGDPSVDAKTPASAYNPQENQILMVWSADMVDGHFQIWGQRIHAGTGAQAGGPFQISFSDTPEFDAIEPDVVYSPFTFEYLVVWSSDVLMDGAEEIHGQRISRYGELVGDRGFRISDMGANDADPAFDANTPAVTWNSVSQEFFVVWAGDDDESGANNDIAIYAQRLASNGTEVGVNDLPTVVFTDWDFPDPDVAHDTVLNQYLVVFEIGYGPGSGASGPEIGAWLLDAAGTLLNPNGLVVSTMGASLSDNFHGKNPVVEYNAVGDQYLVAWDGDHIVNEEFEVYARLVDTGAVAGLTDQIRMSDMGNDGTAGAEALHPALAHDSNSNTYMVTWHGDDYPGSTPLSQPEVFGQQFAPDLFLTQFGLNDFRLSSMGSDPSSPHEAASSTVQFSPNNNLFLVGWSGDDDAGAMAVGEEEIHIQRWGESPTDAPDQPGPRRFALHANVPNPFNPSTTIYFDVPVGAPMVTLRIYDVSGRLVRTLVQGRLDGGRHAIQWQGRDDSGSSVASGVYHLRMEAGEFQSSRKLALVQ